MNLTVKIGITTTKITLPEKLVPGQTFCGLVNGKTVTMQWHLNSRSLVVLEPDGGERLLSVRAGSVRSGDNGDFNVDAEFGISSACPGEHSFAMHGFRASIDYDIPGQNNRQAGKQNKGLLLRSQITGKVLKLLVKTGDTVQAGDSLLIIEAMKMENRIFSSQSGRVASVAVAEGDNVATGRELLRIEST